jgi:hypothetical protein
VPAALFPATVRDRPKRKEEKAMPDKNTVELEVVDQLHISAVSADTMPAGTRFSVSADTAKGLIERGLARKVGRGKAAAAPANKAARAPTNKGGGRRS